MDLQKSLLDSQCHRIRKIDSTGYVTTIAGNGNVGYGDGQGIVASFDVPIGIVLDSSNNLFVVDINNLRISKINSTGYVSTIAGNNLGSNDGQGISASFSSPRDLVFDSGGNLYIADMNNHRIRKILKATLV